MPQPRGPISHEHRLDRELARLRGLNAQLLEVLMSWDRMPGNQRSHEWWERWHAKRKAAIAAAEPKGTI